MLIIKIVAFFFAVSFLLVVPFMMATPNEDKHAKIIKKLACVYLALGLASAVFLVSIGAIPIESFVGTGAPSNNTVTDWIILRQIGILP